MDKTELAYYQEYLNFKGFLELNSLSRNIKNVKFDDIKTKSEHINSRCLNKNFMYILGFYTWIKQENTCKINTPEVKDGEFNLSFEKLNFYPYIEEGQKDKLPIINFSTLLQFIVNDKNITQEVDKVMNTNFIEVVTKERKKDKNSRSVFEYYIDVPAKKMSEATNGVFLEFINLLGFDTNSYLENIVSGSSNGNNGTTFTFEKIRETSPFWINLEKIVTYDLSNIDDDEEIIYKWILLINETANTIIKIVQSFYDMYKNIYNINNEASQSGEAIEALKLEAGDIIQNPSVGSISIDQSLALLKIIKPAFKKSYIVRENNLKPFISMKMVFYNNKAGNAELDKISVDNFDIPYNNILNLEHNIKDHTININFIDTTGVLSELLVQKMYSVSQKRTNLRKLETLSPENNAVDYNSPYFFIVEYGWSGPESTDEDELLEEKVFVKKTTRGFIKNISSQFTMKGNEYALTIQPNDQESLNSFMNNTDIFYFKKSQRAGVPAVYGIIALFLICYNAKIDFFKDTGHPVRDKFINLQELFDGIDGKETNRVFPQNVAKPSIRIRATYNPTNKFRIFITETMESALFNNPYTGAKDENIDELATAFAGPKKNVASELNANRELIGETRYEISEIFYDEKTIERLKTILDKANFRFNAWFIGVYMIWKFKKYFAALKQKFILIDTTGLFDVFNDTDDKINEKKLIDVIKKFNPLCFKNKEKLNEVTNLSHVIEQLKHNIHYKGSSINDCDFGSLIDIDPDPTKVISGQNTQIQKSLTFFTNQINIVFSSINKIGLNIAFDNKNVFHTASSIFSDFVTIMTDLNQKENVTKDYLSRLFSDKDNFYVEKGNDRNKVFEQFKDKIEQQIKDGFNIQKNEGKSIHILYLSYRINPNDVVFLNCSLKDKVKVLAKQIAQSYSFTPRIYPKTRNLNKQFFSQGNTHALKSGTGDIIEFSIDPVDIGNFNSLMISNKNKKNIALNDFSSNMNMKNIYQNAGNFYATYRDINGELSKDKIAQDMARMDLNHQSQMVIKGSITIIGEPYWSNINLVYSKCIYINVFYSNGQRSSHTGLYYVSNATQNISDGKFTTKLDITRAPTFLSSLEKIANKNTYIS